jgi:hypothetical protein
VVGKKEGKREKRRSTWEKGIRNNVLENTL